MDGTLVSSEELWLETEIEVCAALGGVWSSADQAAALGGPLPRVAATILERAGRSDVSVEAVAGLINDQMERRLRSSPVAWMPGARELLLALRATGVPCGLVSASFRNLVDAVLDAVGRELFEVTVAGDEVAHMKPAPDAYLLAAELLGVDIARCVVLEDSATGVRAGEAAGAVVVAVPSITAIAPAPTRTVLASLRDATPAWLQALVSAAGEPSAQALSRWRSP